MRAGAQIPMEDVPSVQKEVVVRCRQLGKPVIVASHLLQSMIEYPTPTRAEVGCLQLSALLLKLFSMAISADVALVCYCPCQSISNLVLVAGMTKLSRNRSICWCLLPTDCHA